MLAVLAVSFAAAAAMAQPAAMPITVLDNGDRLDRSATPERVPRVSRNERYRTEIRRRNSCKHNTRSPSRGLVLPATVSGPAGRPRRMSAAGRIRHAAHRTGAPACFGTPWTWQVLPDGLMYKNYLASHEEARLGTELYHSKELGWMWDSNLGAHVGVIRYGTQDAAWPEGWQLDADGVALVRLDGDRSIVDSDFRFGFPLTWREGPWEFKFGYYHISSHLGDIISKTIRELSGSITSASSLSWDSPIARFPASLYGEANWAFAESGGSQPWEFQFGIDYSPAQPSGICGAIRRDQHQAHGRLELLGQLHR